MPVGSLNTWRADPALPRARRISPRITYFVVYLNAKDPTPSQELHSREAIVPVFAELKKYDATTHFVGQSAIFTLSDDRAAGEATAWRITLRRTVESDACCSPGSATSTHL